MVLLVNQNISPTHGLVVQSQTHIIADVGADVLFKCHYNISSPHFRVTWYKKTIQGNIPIWTLSANNYSQVESKAGNRSVTHIKQASLMPHTRALDVIITDVQVEDEGVYFCKVEHYKNWTDVKVFSPTETNLTISCKYLNKGYNYEQNIQIPVPHEIEAYEYSKTKSLFGQDI